MSRNAWDDASADLRESSLPRPPAGVAIADLEQRVRVTLRSTLAARLGVWVLAAVATGVIGWKLVGLWRAGLHVNDPYLWALTGAWVALILFAVHVWAGRTEIRLSGEKVSVAHRPWHVPMGQSCPTRDVRVVDMDTREHRTTRRRDDGTEEVSYSYTYSVLIVRVSTPRALVAYRGGDERLATFLRRYLQVRIGELRG